jgi:hypothetical protein
MDDSNPERLHLLEPVASQPVRDFIQATAEAVWVELSQPGMGVDNCLAAVGVWARYLRGVGIPHIQLGRHLMLGQAETGGYQLPSGELVDHHFLAVGEERALFDPTAGSDHINHSTDMPLDRYLVADDIPFPEWRRHKLELA